MAVDAAGNVFVCRYRLVTNWPAETPGSEHVDERLPGRMGRHVSGACYSRGIEAATRWKLRLMPGREARHLELPSNRRAFASQVPLAV
jgi:hypothetical protein